MVGKIPAACLHMTGGEGYAGFFAGGNEAGYGRCVSRQQLPTSEIYALCHRCSKEWHHPRWTEAFYPSYGSEKLSGMRAVVVGAKPLSEYVTEEREWKEALSWRARTFENPDGSIPASVQFRLPDGRQSEVPTNDN